LAAQKKAVAPSRYRGALLAAALMTVLSVLVGCGASGGNNAAAERVAAQAAASPLYVRGGYAADFANEAWLAAIPAPAASMGLPAGANCEDLQTWLHAHGGIDSTWSYVTVLLRARVKADVVVTAAESVILGRTPAASTPYTVTCVPNKQSFVDQEDEIEWPDAPFPGLKVDVNHYLATAWQPGHYQAGDYSFNMEPGGEEYLGFTGYTSTCDCEWGVELYLTVNGKPEHVLVENGTVPFRTTPGPSYPDDSSRNAVWCAVSGKPRLVTPSVGYCPPPVTNEEQPIY
jgi:hypothetical protein